MPEPATVVTTPSRDSRRMRWFALVRDVEVAGGVEREPDWLAELRVRRQTRLAA